MIKYPFYAPILLRQYTTSFTYYTLMYISGSYYTIHVRQHLKIMYATPQRFVHFHNSNKIKSHNLHLSHSWPCEQKDQEQCQPSVYVLCCNHMLPSPERVHDINIRQTYKDQHNVSDPKEKSQKSMLLMSYNINVYEHPQKQQSITENK